MNNSNHRWGLFSDMILDEVGNVINRMDYTAFGEVRAETGTSPTDYQYTGQRSYLDSFGLHYYIARWYDPVTAHFAQADSIIPKPGNSADWNRYAYVLYNPMRYTDPTGHSPGDLPGIRIHFMDHEIVPYDTSGRRWWEEDRHEYLRLYSDAISNPHLFAGNDDGPANNPSIPLIVPGGVGSYETTNIPWMSILGLLHGPLKYGANLSLIKQRDANKDFFIYLSYSYEAATGTLAFSSINIWNNSNVDVTVEKFGFGLGADLDVLKAGKSMRYDYSHEFNLCHGGSSCSYPSVMPDHTSVLSAVNVEISYNFQYGDHTMYFTRQYSGYITWADILPAITNEDWGHPWN